MARLALAMAALAGLAFLLWLTIAHFIIGVMADPRADVSRADLIAAAGYFPRSSLIHARLTEIELAETIAHADAAQDAIEHAQLAVSLSPQDYRNWLLLASAQEANEETDAALVSLRNAVRLAPEYTEAHWQLANLLLRAEQLDEALPEFHRAVSLDDTKLRQTLDLIFQITEGDINRLTAVVGTGARQRLALAQFLLEREQTDEAIRVFDNVSQQELRQTQETGQFINSLVAARQFSLARKLWSRVISDRNEVPLLWNGSFEEETRPGLGQFDWQIGESQFAWIGIVSGAGRTGARALRIDFAGRDSTRLTDEIRQMLIVQPGTQYRLTCFVRAIDLVTPSGPRVVVMSAGSELVSSRPLPEGEQDWASVSVDFTAPSDNPAVFVTIHRAPEYSYDKPTSGTVLFDDFALTPLTAIVQTGTSHSPHDRTK